MLTFNLQGTIRDRSISSRFTINPNKPQVGQLPIPNYRQRDGHSCGFLSILAVIHHFYPLIPTQEILDFVGPNEDGCNDAWLRKSLRKFGVSPWVKSDLSLPDLKKAIDNNSPIIVTVEPDHYSCDHWTVIRGIDFENKWVYLTNYEEEVMAWKDFRKIWSPCGEGIICIPLLYT